MIYVFVVDTSASMNQVFSHGLSYLDCAKSGIEHFFQWEQRRSDRKGNKYVLIDYSDPPGCIKAGVHDSIPQLLLQLKTLNATDISNPGQAFHAAFDYLNAYRYQAGLETIGKGRYVSAIEPTMLMWFTDGGNFSFFDKANNKCVIQNRLQIPGLHTPGSNVYLEPFRWDQRLHTFLLAPEGKKTHPEVGAMSGAMYSDVYAIWTKDHMKRCIENCMGAHKPPHPDVLPQTSSVTQPSVWVHMEEISASPSGNSRPKVFRMNIFPQADQGGTFPLPEPYVVDSQLNMPPQKSAIPYLVYTTTDMTYTIPHGFPYDRFTIEQSSFKELLARSSAKSSSSQTGICWTLYMRHSSPANNGLGEPIGFLKVSTASQRSGVMMYLLPYNFPKLFKLIDPLTKDPRMKANPPTQYMNAFHTYLHEIPPYYHAKLRLIICKVGLERLFPLSLVPNMLEWPISTFLNTIIEQSKFEFDKFSTSIKLRNKLDKKQHTAIEILQHTSNLVENVFDVSRDCVLGELRLLQFEFNTVVKQSQPPLKKLVRDQSYEDAQHSVPISEMSNHHSKLYIPPLRSPFESDDDILAKLKRDPFGNPWVTKQSTKQNTVIAIQADEDEISMEASLMREGDKVADAAKCAADLENARTHARKLSRRRSVSVSGSDKIADSLNRIDGGNVDIAEFVQDRVPSLVSSPLLLVLPPETSFFENQNGAVDILGFIKEIREGERKEGAISRKY